MSENGVVGETRTRELLTIMRENNALNEGEYRALLGALEADLSDAGEEPPTAS